MATIDDIAAEAELGKGTLYRHYRSKEDILLAINEQALQELHQHCVQAVAADDSGLDKVLRFTRAYYDFVVANPVYFGFIAFFESPFTSTNPAVVYEMSHAIYQFVMELMDEGKRDGSVRTDLKTELLANTLWAGSYGIMQFIVSKGHYLAEDLHIDINELFDTYLSALKSGLQAPG